MKYITVELWFTGQETALARYYSVGEPKRTGRRIWVPRSLYRRMEAWPSGKHLVDLPEWFVHKHKLQS